ncbi:hypothetical protein HGO38_24225 [Rhizobium sp. CG5]|uniref:hypothetical protein n=1 Tax=Rhizobium sp. CG5 TaxID=2726076 RepID=UPI0020337F37|nr:hypothetical protein [Rhizobium sp. CG5]MCM2476558.1 hypothetical protein [Rhizobium sp. CG5]
MQITISSSEAIEIISARYAGSKPISKNPRPADAQSLAWWTSSPKDERVEQDRKRAALSLYMDIASRAVQGLPPNTFPAAFAFIDRTRYRPDKGVIKALLQAGAIEECFVANELCFSLTVGGQRLIS